MNIPAYIRKYLISLIVISICFLFSSIVFCADEYDPDKISQIPYQNILNNESLPANLSNSGALSYNVPIKVPPGRGGLQPELALIYNSSNKQNGWLGKGWNLDLGSIKRSSKDRINFNDNDSFVHDGMDLVRRSSSHYSARIEGDFSYYVYNGQNSGWVVKKNDGRKYSYGTSSNSQIVSPQGVVKWLLSSIADANGNTISISYNNTGSEIYLNQINYEPGGSRVEFILEDRNDIKPSFNNFKKLELTKRLKEIRVYGASSGAYKYALQYNYGHFGNSLISSIQEYGSNFNSTSLPAKTYTYEPGSSFNFSSGSSAATTEAYSYRITHFADINADGFPDMIRFGGSTNGGTNIYVHLNDTHGNFNAPRVTHIGLRLEVGYIHFGDINGDRRADLLAGNSGCGYMGIYLATFNPIYPQYDGRFVPNGTINYYRDHGYLRKHESQLADVNGDGLADFVQYPQICWDCTPALIRVNLANGRGSFDSYRINTPTNTPHFIGRVHMMDFNGDGMVDIINLHNSRIPEVFLANGDGTFGSGGSGITSDLGGMYARPGSVNFVDINNDGFTDLVSSEDRYDIHTFFSDGTGKFIPAAATSAVNFSNDACSVQVTDINGDGFSDLVQLTPGIIVYYYLGNGTGVFNYLSSYLTSERCPSVMMDLNGDALSDIVKTDYDTQSVHSYLSQGLSPSNVFPELLTGINNGYGVTSTINYKLSTAYPLIYKASPGYENSYLPFITKFVDSIVVNDGIGNSSISTTYNYAGAYYDFKEREFLGLKHIVKVNPNNTEQVSDYRIDDYYLKGRISTTRYADRSSSDSNSTTTIWTKSAIEGDVFWVRPDQVNSSIVSGGVAVTSNINYGYASSSGFGYANSITKSGSGASNHVETRAMGNQGDWIWRLTDNRIQQDGATARHTTYQYDGYGNLRFETNENNNGPDAIIRRDYDGYGNVSVETDPNGRITTFGYLAGTHLSSKNFEGLITTYSNFNQWGQPRQMTDENNNITQYTYDGYGRIQREDYPGPGYKDIVYNDTARPRYIIDRAYDGSGTFADTYKYIDGLDRVLQTTRKGLPGANITMRYFYDSAGRNYNTIGPFFTSNFNYPGSYPSDTPYQQITSFDFVDRPKTIQTPHDDGSVANTIISYPGFNRIITDPDARPTTEGRDFLGRIQTITEANGVSTSYDYNAAGDLTQVNGPLNNTIVLTRNWLGHITQQDDPDLGIRTYTYKPNGEIETQTDNMGQIITFGYDNRNRLESKTYTNTSTPEDEVILTYDSGVNGNGRLYSVSKGSVILTNDSYDEVGKLKQKTMTMDGQDYTFSYFYNPAGLINEIVYPDAYSVNYAYHPGTGLISSVFAINPDIEITIPSYSNFGKIRALQYPGITSTFDYFSRTGRTHSINVPNLMELQYNYTYAGDVLSKYDNIRNLSFVYDYDALHRLTNETAIGPFSGQKGNTLNLFYEGNAPHAANRITTNQGERSLLYDTNGNLTTGYDFKTPGQFPERRISYNADNMPLTMEYEPEGGSILAVNYTYDGNGRRIKKQAGSDIVRYIDNIYELRNEQATKYIFAGNLRLAKIKGSDVQYYHKDHLGSSSVMSDENGTQIESIAYEAYGSQRKFLCAAETEDLNYTFTDQEWDAETGLYNYDARLYDPVLGRFLTADSIVPNWHDPQMLDRYAYVRNNPVKYVDPDGHDIFLFFWKSEQTNSGVGHVATGVGTKKNMTVYDPNPSHSNHNKYVDTPNKPFVNTGSMEKISSEFHNEANPALILQIKTVNGSKDKEVIKAINKLVTENKNTWTFAESNCADVAKTGIRETDINPGKAFIVSTPQELAQDLYENNKDSKKIDAIKGSWKSYRDSTGALRGGASKGIKKWRDKIHKSKKNE